MTRASRPSPPGGPETLARRGHGHRVGIDTSNELNLPRQTVWVFDNMIIRMTESDLKAFVPAAS